METCIHAQKLAFMRDETRLHKRLQASSSRYCFYCFCFKFTAHLLHIYFQSQKYLLLDFVIDLLYFLREAQSYRVAYGEKSSKRKQIIQYISARRTSLTENLFIVFQMRVIRQDGNENRILWKLAYEQNHSFSTKTQCVYPHPIFFLFFLFKHPFAISVFCGSPPLCIGHCTSRWLHPCAFL